MEGKRRQSRKSLKYIFVFKEKQIRCENYLYRVFIIGREMTM